MPFIASPSSSPVINKLIDPFNLLDSILLTAAIKQAIEDFISLAPLPTKNLFIILGLNGSVFQFFKFPGGTTSVCPAKQKLGLDLPNLAYKFLTFFESLDLNSKTLQSNPIGFSILTK